MRLFNNNRTYNYIEQEKFNVKNTIEILTNSEICNSSIEDLQEYFYEKFKLNLIEIESDFNYINHDAQEAKIKKYNHFYRFGGYDEPEYFLVDGYKIIYHIPFEGDVDLLYLEPNSRFLTAFEVDNVISPTDDKEGTIIFSQSYERASIDNQENMLEFIKNEFTCKFANHIEMIKNVNADINGYNSSLNPVIKKHLETRLKKAEDYIKLREKLNIPLELNPNAPNTKPIRLKKVKKNETSQLPKAKVSPVEYCISDDDYNNIKNIINLSCISMEKTARTFSKLYEEELRDVILSSLNTHYRGNATGETFNKRGKSDIHIPFDNKSAYIGECKIWTGKGLFLDAISQLFSYMRWRDTKTSLIIFNKKNKDFSKVLETIETILSEHDLCVKRMKMTNNEWQCDFKKNIDSTEIVKINIVIYDLYI